MTSNLNNFDNIEHLETNVVLAENFVTDDFFNNTAESSVSGGTSTSTTASIISIREPFVASTVDVSNVVVVNDNLKKGDYQVSDKAPFILGSSFKTEEAVKDFYVSNSIVPPTNEDQNTVVTGASKLTMLQSKSVFDFVEVNDPLVMDNKSLKVIHQDIYGNEYNSECVFITQDDIKFALAYYDIDSNTYSPVESPYKIFKLYQKITPSSYYVYAFNDQINGTFSYRRYLGNIEMINDVPYGTDVPYYDNLVKTNYIDAASVKISTYSVSCRNENDENIVLKEIYIPELTISQPGGNSNELEVCPLQSYPIIVNGYRIEDNRIYDSDGVINKIEDAKKVFSKAISDYSLHSSLVLIKEEYEIDERTNKKNGKIRLKVKPHVLFEPVKITTDTNEYIPYNIVSDNSAEIFRSVINDGTILVESKEDKTKKDEQSCQIIKFGLVIDGNLENTIEFVYHNNDFKHITKYTDKKVSEYKDVTDYTFYKGSKFYKLNFESLKNKKTVYFNIGCIVQDRSYNFIEYFGDNPFITKNFDDIVVNVLTISLSETFLNKLYYKKSFDGKYYVAESALYNRERIIINPVSESNVDYTYVKFLQEMSSTYNVRYISNYEHKSNYEFDPIVSQISHKKERLFERAGINTTYVYFSPKDNAYVNYENNIIEYKNSFYGSDIFDNVNFDFSTHEITFLDIFERTAVDSDVIKNFNLSQASTYKSYLSGNVEQFINTYAVEPLTLSNDYEYEFARYKYVEPVKSYVINEKEGITANNYTEETSYICFSYLYDINSLSFNYTKTTNNVANESSSYIDIILDETTNITSDNILHINDISSNTEYNSADINYLKEFDKNDVKITSLYISTSEDTVFENLLSVSKTFAEYKSDDNSIVSKDYSNSHLLLYGVLCIINYNNNLNLYLETSNNCKYTFTELKCDKFTENTINDKIYISHGKTLDNNEIIDLSYQINAKSSCFTEKTYNSMVFVDINNQNLVSISTTKALNYTDKVLNGDKPYEYDEIITRDGYWKREYNKKLKPLINISYSYSANSIDISNAYIVPTVKNERLGFIHNNRVSYFDFINELVEDYKYVYYNPKTNVQEVFEEDTYNLVLNVGNNKYYGVTKESSKYFTVLKIDKFTITGLCELSGNKNRLQDFGLINDSYNFKPTKDTDTLTYNKFNCLFNIDDNIFDDKFILTDTSSSYNLYKITSRISDSEYNFVKIRTDSYENPNKPSFFISKTDDLLFCTYSTFTYETDEDGKAYNITYIKDNDLVERDENKTILRLKPGVTEDEANLLKHKIESSSIKEVFRRMIVKQDKKLQEFVIQEDEMVPQYAHIDTSFSLVNGKKVNVVDQVYVPETYTTVVTVNPDTKEYETKRVVTQDAHMAYSYEISDIPFITATYLYYGGDEGIKIQGMDTLIQRLSTSQVFKDSYGNILTPYTGGTSYGSSFNLDISSFEDAFSSYFTTVSEALIHINEAIDRNTKKISYALTYTTNESSYITDLTDRLSSSINSLNTNGVVVSQTNTSNFINAQKNMVTKLTDSIDNQTSTLSRLMLLDMMGKAGESYAYNTQALFTNILSTMSAVIPKNWQSVTKIGYQVTSEVELVSYRATAQKHSKVIGKEQRVSQTKTITTSYKYDVPSYISFAYQAAFENNSSVTERIGLHLHKESRDFAYKGEIYHEDYYTYQNIADILADLHVSNRMPTRKEFIVDVSKRLYINSDFIFAYTSPTEYALRAIRRADILWTELVNANIVEPESSSYRPLPEIPRTISSKWWKDKNNIAYIAYALNLDQEKFSRADESVFLAMEASLTRNNMENDLTKSVTELSYNMDKQYYLTQVFDADKVMNEEVMANFESITKVFKN